jgi:cell division transport system permease protein
MLAHNLGNVVSEWKTDVRITAYLRDGFPISDINRLMDEISVYPEVESVIYITKDQAFDEFRAMLGKENNLLEGLEEHLLPASLRLTPHRDYRNMDGIHSILARMGDNPLVEEVNYGREWLQRLERVIKAFHFIAVGFGIILCLAAVFIISNTIKLTVLARRDELEIMRLVGATEVFIRTPFLIEGLIQGFAGSAISLAMLTILYRVLIVRMDSAIYQILGIGTLNFIPPESVIAILLAGMVLGGMGSLASVGRFSRK